MTKKREEDSVLTLAYCRVSTEEQAAEGFSIEGQADKLRSYSDLRDLGEITVISDPGLSGKDMNRPGLQQLISAVRADHVSHILIWRLDRLSRNVQDLNWLADLFGEHGVVLHSLQEHLDPSSASGRMFYNMLGTYAQFFREQLAENVKMGNDRAVKEGKWINRPKTGYDLIEGELVSNDDAVRVREIFRLRAEGRSYREIEDKIGIKYSTVSAILRSRIYLGEVLHNGEWFQGHHEPIVTEETWRAANRGFVPGRPRGKDILSGRVRCGLCERRMAIDRNGQGRFLYRCRHRGQGCGQPARTNTGLLLAAVLGLKLLGGDERLQAAIRRHLADGGRPEPVRARRRRRTGPAETLATLSGKRRKLLDLYYQDGISAELFAEEEARLCAAIEATRSEASEEEAEGRMQNDLEMRFEQVAAILRDLDVEAVWMAAEDQERRVLIEELIEWVSVFPDHLEVTVSGAPPLHVLYGEVGMKESGFVGVGGAFGSPSTPALLRGRLQFRAA